MGKVCFEKNLLVTIIKTNFDYRNIRRMCTINYTKVKIVVLLYLNFLTHKEYSQHNHRCILMQLYLGKRKRGLLQCFYIITGYIDVEFRRSCLISASSANKDS